MVLCHSACIASRADSEVSPLAFALIGENRCPGVEPGRARLAHGNGSASQSWSIAMESALNSCQGIAVPFRSVLPMGWLIERCRMLIFAIHPPQADRLARVIAQMRELGVPRIRAIDCGDHFVALEGSHRLAAASLLGLIPEIIVLHSDALIEVCEFDWYDAARWPNTVYPAAEIARELRSRRSVGYGFRATAAAAAKDC